MAISQEKAKEATNSSKNYSWWDLKSHWNKQNLPSCKTKQRKVQSFNSEQESLRRDQKNDFLLRKTAEKITREIAENFGDPGGEKDSKRAPVDGRECWGLLRKPQ